MTANKYQDLITYMQDTQYPQARRTIDGIIRVLYRFAVGFAQGVSFAVLFAALVLPGNLTLLALILGLSFGTAYLLKECYKVVKTNIREEKLFNLLVTQGYAFNHHETRPVVSLEKNATKQFYKAFLNMKKGYSLLFNLLGFVASGISIFGLVFFFLPGVAGTIPALIKLEISLLSGLTLSLIGLTYKYALRKRLKNRLYKIEKYRSTVSRINLYHNKKQQYKQIFCKTTTNENFLHLYISPLIECFLSMFSGITNSFGVLLLFCIGINISLPWITPITALLIATVIGLAIGIRDAIDRTRSNSTMLSYIDFAVDTSENPNEAIPSFFSYRRKLDQTYDAFMPFESKFIPQNDSAHPLSLFFKYLASFISGASSGIAFSSALVSSLFLLSISTGPFTLGVIFLTGTIFGCTNLYREHFTKSIQHERIDYYEHALTHVSRNTTSTRRSLLVKPTQAVQQDRTSPFDFFKKPLKKQTSGSDAEKIPNADYTLDEEPLLSLGNPK